MAASPFTQFPNKGLSPGDADKAAAFIRENLPLTEVPGTGLRLHLAGPRSGLSRLVPAGGTPYWAHAWPGGMALARHLLAHPDQFQSRGHPMGGWEFGSGCGLVAIAACLTGRWVNALDSDPLAVVATRVNAEANGATFSADWGGFAPNSGPLNNLAHQPMLLLAGDVFYDKAVASEAAAYFDRQPSYVTILIGDIGRRFLPRERLEPLASYPVRDVGDPPGAPLREGWVFRWKPPD